MLERIPAEDNLYDETGKVKDINAAQEMAEAEQYHRDLDAEGMFRPSKKELTERKTDLDIVGRKALAEKERQREIDRQSELQRQAEISLREIFISRNLRRDGLSQEVWLALSPGERKRAESEWRRREQRSPEWKLEQRLKSLVGRRVMSFEVGDLGDVDVHFDDGLVLSFQSWNARDDTADYDAIEVKQATA